MPTLTLDVSTEVATRMRAAYGVANNTDLKTAIIKDVKEKVVNYESALVFQTETAKIDAARTALKVATAAAETSAKNDIIVT